MTLSGTNTIEKLAEIGITGEGASGAKNISWDKDNTFKGKIKDGKLYLSAPVAISLRDDSGVYEDGTGVIRIITTFNKLPDADDIVSFGTWILPLSKFSESEFDSKKGEGLFVKTEIDTAKLIEGSSYHVDLTNIPKDALSGDVIAISFVKLSDSETVTTAKYIVKGVNADNRLKSE